MKGIFTILLVSISLTTIAQERCGTEIHTENMMKKNASYAIARNKVNFQTEKWIKNHPNHSEKTIITIPIIVHVLWKTNTHNISDAQIQSQIDVLNEDYRRANIDKINTPNVWQTIAADSEIEFCLASTDQNGNPTTGIERIQTTHGKFGMNSDIHTSSAGGADDWPNDDYLNIWVCDIQSGLLGYASPPSNWIGDGDGLVIGYQYFGRIGNVQAPYHKGRTATHEIGHYLGLNHTFAEGSWSGQGPCDGPQGNLQCCDNDNGNVDDTPATDGIYFGTVTSSTNNNTCNDLSYSNVFTTNVLDMDENFMAYSTNSWMFTNDQVSVMKATLNGYRSSLKNSTVSINCDASVGIGLNNYKLENLNIYPNPTLGKLNIVSVDKIKTLSITNIIGKELLFAKDFSANTIDLSSYESGVYFINISTDKGTHIEKIILTK